MSDHFMTLQSKGLSLPQVSGYCGVFQLLLRDLKELIKKDLDNYWLTFEVVQTVLFEVEFIMNNRPFIYVYLNAIEPCITLNDLLFNKHLS